MFRRIFVAAVLMFVFTSAGGAQGDRTANGSRGYYSKQQASRGRQLYAQHCASCHLGDLRGSVNSGPSLRGDQFLQRWYTVGDLFSMTSMNQPADNRRGLSIDVYLNVVAYLLAENGFPAGSELKHDVRAMKNMVINAKGAPKLKPLSTDGATAGYYTVEQAMRGKAYFDGACASCHAADRSGPSGPQPLSFPRGYMVGRQRSIGNFVNDQFLDRWGSVADLYNKNRTTQPGYDAGGLSDQEYVDITAFLLHANGAAAGSAELRPDVNAMRNMTLEKGFTSLFNGRDFGGWSFLLGPNCTPRPAGCGQTEPGNSYVIENSMIFSTGRPHGYMYTQKKYMNFTLRLDYRYKPYEGMESERDFWGNSGVLLFVNEHQVWPRMLEVQLKAKDEGRMFGISAKVTATPVDEETRQRAKRPAGEWNALEIVSKDGQIKCYLNGILLSTVSEHEFKEPGHIALESESGQIYFRNIRIREEGGQASLSTR